MTPQSNQSGAASGSFDPQHKRVPRLKYARDWQSLLYMAAFPALVIWQWLYGFSVALYLILLFLTLGIGVIHHNHTHVRMWHGKRANRCTDMLITLLQGHPTCVFFPTHVANHHRYKHGELDVARTYRFAAGDTNTLPGYLLHPFQAISVLYPAIYNWLGRMRRYYPGVWRYCIRQYVLWLLLWTTLLTLNPGKALLFVIVPQLHGLHWLLATNYLQHAHADGAAQGRQAGSPIAFARNFEGWVNPLLFNIGLHTAHHEHGRTHWSRLTQLHEQQYRSRTHPAMLERGLASYMIRTFIMGTFSQRYRSQSLMHSDANRLPPPTT
ncbi:fatty acid desaturase [Advenella mimigardefordensis]|uniref:Putative fatty acid desaturase n=1 Tax=Advenella mimigardefordensis (strain DSM 17166 / LMG 22922 / DPN7) TaxID=1247726 RepID=W0PEV2_ADVMD|nr:fatty acid desaturase [Advenella mimigardefordensis]AHG64067.1 putative fatty acid desaturase [Advenella mimigardefordensis DPN7]